MDIVITDPDFHAIDIVDDFESVIWTERYADAGDVKLSVPDTGANRIRLPEGTFLSTPDSLDAMMIETRTAKEGLLTLEGPSITAFLRNRIARDSWSNLHKSWEITGAPGWICGEIVRQMCTSAGWITDGSVIQADVGIYEAIDKLIIGSTVAGTSIKFPVPFGNVYDGVKTVADAYQLGFRLYPANVTDNDHDLVFTTYKGIDRTRYGGNNQIVAFSSALDSLTDVTELRSIAGYRNVAYAWAPQITAQLYIVGIAYDGLAASTRNFERRSIMVLADDINPDADTSNNGEGLRKLLEQKAKDALANNNYVKMADGMIVPQNAYRYGTDYNLGDIVELSTPNAGASSARITEYIRAQDKASGYRAYPTLSVQDQ